MGYPTCAILRTDLQAVLLRRAREAGVPVAFGREATAIANDPDGRAVVHFADGGRLSPTWSSARTDVCPRWRGPMWRAATRRSIKASSTGSAWPKARATWWTAPRSTITGAWRARRHRGAGAAQGLLGGRAGADAGAGAGLGGRRADGEWRKVRRLFERWPDPIGAVIDATPPRALRLIAVHDLEPLARWHRGNVLLVGDAAHAPLPTSGQGACQALEDAWHLARCLEDPAMGSGAELEQALERFGGLRREKTEAITRQARYFARELFITDPQACRERDARVRASDPLQGVHALAQGWGGACLCLRWPKPGRPPLPAAARDGSGNVGHEMAGRPRGGLD